MVFFKGRDEAGVDASQQSLFGGQFSGSSPRSSSVYDRVQRLGIGVYLVQASLAGPGHHNNTFTHSGLTHNMNLPLRIPDICIDVYAPL